MAELKQMTAIEWLVQEISTKLGTNNLLDDLYKQAKAMEKEQIIDAANLSIKDRWYVATKYSNCGEQYYNKTYGK